jgi:hypothetical protein
MAVVVAVVLAVDVAMAVNSPIDGPVTTHLRHKRVHHLVQAGRALGQPHSVGVGGATAGQKAAAGQAAELQQRDLYPAWIQHCSCSQRCTHLAISRKEGVLLWREPLAG